MTNRIEAKKIDTSEIGHILIRATNWVGDLVMSLPTIEAVRTCFPSSSIVVLARPWVAPLLENHPAVDEVIHYKKGTGILPDTLEIIRVIRQMKKREFDLAILLQNAFEAALLTFLGGCRYRLGYNTDRRGFLLTHPVFMRDKFLRIHQVEYYLNILKVWGLQADSSEPHLYLTSTDIEKAKGLLFSGGTREDDLVVGLSPGAMYGDAKRWPPERFAAIGDWAVERWGAKVLIAGSGKETQICNSVSASMKHDSLNLCGRTSLGEAAGVISLCHFFITNDSGLMHISAALGIPTVAIFGSTDPVATGPRGPRATIIKHDIECAPCLKSECPTDRRCMMSIQPEEVWDEMVLLRESGE